ncbi:hypothetical protein M422DRAFT_238926 [Sphaerobolus stellatus SS14]|nr:hypothetical protein M422DRAFT_238926 [Sphaerobolus stellatus SS14]
MSIPNAIRDNNDGYFLEEDIDIMAWLSKIATDIPYPAFMHQMKAVFGSPLNFEMAFSGFETNSLIPNLQSTRWITDGSTVIRVVSYIRKGHKDASQVPAPNRFMNISSLTWKGMWISGLVVLLEWNVLHQSTPAPNKGKKPLIGPIQSRTASHARQLAKTRESSQQRLDVDLDVYNQSHDPVLPYDEEPPSSAPDVEMSAPVMTGASSTLQDESAMNLDHELDDLYN